MKQKRNGLLSTNGCLYCCWLFCFCIVIRDEASLDLVYFKMISSSCFFYFLCYYLFSQSVTLKTGLFNFIFILTFLSFFFYFMYMNVYLNVCLCTVCVCCLWRLDEGIRSPGAGVRDVVICQGSAGNIEPGSFERTASDCSCRAFSSALIYYYYIIFTAKKSNSNFLISFM